MLNAPVEVAFAYLDDFKKLSAHMASSSSMMFGSTMEIATDAGGGRAIGSRVRMYGSLMGMKLALEEIVTDRAPPLRKVWETVDTDLIVIGQYRLGFELEPMSVASKVRVFIDYDLAVRQPARSLSLLFAGMYARWCTERMSTDAAKHFLKTGRAGDQN